MSKVYAQQGIQSKTSQVIVALGERAGPQSGSDRKVVSDKEALNLGTI